MGAFEEPKPQEKNRLRLSEWSCLGNMNAAADEEDELAWGPDLSSKTARFWQFRKIEKCYQAIVTGEFPSEQSFRQPVADKPAVSHCVRLGYNQQLNRSLLRVKIETGRKHQIRRHLSQAGYPIVGDRLYGDGQHQLDLQLCCEQLAFTCPISGTEQHFQLTESAQLQLNCDDLSGESSADKWVIVINFIDF